MQREPRVVASSSLPLPQERPTSGGLIGAIGPGVITGAADDDPSGIATYSQAGANFGVGLLWTVVLTLPMMVAVQSLSARIGRVTGRGLAANMVRVFPRWLVTVLVSLLFVANTVNIGADLAAMGAATRLMFSGNQHLYTGFFGAGSLLAIAFIPYSRYVKFLKWLTLSLFSYVGVVFAVHIDWAAVAFGAAVPHFELSSDALTVIVAVFGTTISPYLFFWQSSQEVEEEKAAPQAEPLINKPQQGPRELTRIQRETWIGMGISNLIAFFIMLTTAATLHASGHTTIQSSEQAAEALRPIAGPWAFFLFSFGIIGTGLLAVPVLAASAAYAIAEVQRWRTGLERTPRNARRFYVVIALAIVLGIGVDFSPLDPIKALFWSAVLNGLITVPILAAMMIVGSRPERMDGFSASTLQRIFGWLTTAVMTAASIAMFVLM
jgi:NRAMP (natural resistance-associated macrophage protein)-like metal ion transporter